MSKRVSPRERRVNAANASAELALNVFHRAASDLESAAATLDAVAEEVAAEIAELTAQRVSAICNAVDYREAAGRIRGLVG